jgi:N-methylhydantoinase B
VFERGEERQDIFDLIWNNVRWPEGVRVDNYALIAATKICEQRILSLIEKYGKEAVLGCVEDMLARTERAVREEIRKMPDGVYVGESATDDDGSELGVPVWVRCKVTIRGDEMTVDFSESDKQRKGFVNSVYASTYSNTLATIFLFLDPALAPYHNEGSMRPLQVVAPEGSVVHPRYPATVGASPVNVGTQVMESVLMAMSKALPGRAMGAWGRHYSHFIYGLDPRINQQYVQVLFEPDGGSGAVRGFDGYEGVTMLVTLGEAVKGDMETIEVRFPWRVDNYEFETDSCGAGKWRGASGIRWEMVNEGSPAGMSTGNAEGETTHGAGALGGQSAPFNRAYVTRRRKKIPLRAHRLYSIQPGDVLTKITGGGAGVGDALERAPEKVREDVLNGFVSYRRAKEVYKVVIDPVTSEVDLKATKRLRDNAKASQVRKKRRHSPRSH